VAPERGRVNRRSRPQPGLKPGLVWSVLFPAPAAGEPARNTGCQTNGLLPQLMFSRRWSVRQLLGALSPASFQPVARLTPDCCAACSPSLVDRSDARELKPRIVQHQISALRHWTVAHGVTGAPRLWPGSGAGDHVVAGASQQIEALAGPDRLWPGHQYGSHDGIPPNYEVAAWSGVATVSRKALSWSSASTSCRTPRSRTRRWPAGKSTSRCGRWTRKWPCVV
jgi:hypothetical protein